jgi:hypothetical protein
MDVLSLRVLVKKIGDLDISLPLSCNVSMWPTFGLAAKMSVREFAMLIGKTSLRVLAY